MAEVLYDYRPIAQLKREKAANERRDITDQEIVDFVGMSPSTFYRYLREAAIIDPPIRINDAICEYFNVPRDFFRVGDAATDRSKAEVRVA